MTEELREKSVAVESIAEETLAGISKILVIVSKWYCMQRYHVLSMFLLNKKLPTVTCSVAPN
jgi:hypothetical protein